MTTRLDPLDELSEKSLSKVRTITDAIHKVTDNMEANLETWSGVETFHIY